MFNINITGTSKKLSGKKSYLKNFFLWSGIIIISILVLLIISLWPLFTEPEVSNLPDYHPFVSANAKEKYLIYYNLREKQWPVPFINKYIVTSFGKTFVRVCGKENAPPLVLLPSVNTTSLMWIPNIKDLSANFRIYAVDNIYDVGKSVYTRVVHDANDMTLWLDELFTKLELKDNINLAGLSFGGWLACQYTLHYPERLNKTILLAPAGTVFDLPFGFIWRAILSLIPNKYFMKNMSRWAFCVLAEKKDSTSVALFNEAVNDAFLAMECFKFKKQIAPTVVSDDDFKKIKVPVLFLVGEKEVIYPADSAVKRINKVAPEIKTEIIKDASHDLTYVQSRIVTKKIIEFVFGSSTMDSSDVQKVVKENNCK